MWVHGWLTVYAETPPNFEVDNVRFVQPVGFVWFSKPRYRIKAKSRKVK